MTKRKNVLTLLASSALFLFASTRPASAASISGFVVDLDSNPIANIAVNLSGASGALAVTSSTGYYVFPGLSLASNYAVTASNNVNYTLSPSTVNYTGLASDQIQNFVYGKRWDGGGADNLASNALNWSGKEAPRRGDVLRFDVTNSTKSCYWDIAVSTMEAIQLKPSFSSSVVTGVDVAISSVEVAGGEFLTGTRELHLTKNFMHTGGRFRNSGTVFFEGSAFQTVTMVKTDLGGGLYDSYFSNFRVQSSSSVRALSDLIIDGNFNISQGRFESGVATHTFTGGTQSGAGGSYFYDDRSGVFVPGSGQVVFDGAAGNFQIQQGGGSSFNHMSVLGGAVVTSATKLTVNGDLAVGQTGSTARLVLADALTHTIGGTASIGPASTGGSATFSMGTSTVTFLGNVVVGTANFSIRGGIAQFRSGGIDVRKSGTVTIGPTGNSRFVFWSNTAFTLTEGALSVTANATITSSAPAIARYAMNMNGTVDITSTTILDSMDANGFRMGVGANPVNLKFMDFRSGITGGGAINFAPVTVATVTVQGATFSTSFSTNVRAVVDPLVIAAADIDVIDSAGLLIGPTYEDDVSNVVNWGTLGTPTGFTGLVQSPTSINWSWTIVNHPLGFLVMSSTGGGPVSPSLTFNTTTWTETNLSTNTPYTRYVQAFTDVATANSSSVAKYTDAAPPSSFSALPLGFSSTTISWSANNNPAPTIYTLERSTNDSTYVQIASGTFASIVPTIDTGLNVLSLYYYRVTAQNGDGRATASVKTSTTTQAIPPPVVSTVTPNSVSNLGTVTVTINGYRFQNGAVFRIKRSGSTTLTPTDISVLSATTMTGTVRVTGAFASAWDVEIENPDGNFSGTTGNGAFTITDATSTSPVTIKTYLSTATLSFTTDDGGSALTMAPSAMSSGRIYVSADPENTPLTASAAAIATANANLQGLTLIPGTIRELNAYTTGGRFTSNFGSAVSMTINFPDADGNRIVDGLSVRTSGLRAVTLDETNSRWTTVTTASLDTANNRITIPLLHFSVYAIVGSPASTSLSEVKVYPSPWKPASGSKFDAGGITISDLTESGTIRIFTINAELVRELRYELTNAGIVTWDGKNSDGVNVASGVYLLFIEATSGDKKTFKVGIER